MVIKCPRCSSRYKIDAAGLPDEGTYARCRKCENVFFVRKRSREEVSLLRKNIRKRKDDKGGIFAGHETPRLPDSIIEAAEDSTAEEGQFLARPQATAVVEEPAQETGVDERAGIGGPDAGGDGAEATLTDYSTKPTVTRQAQNIMPVSGAEAFAVENGSAKTAQTPATVKLDNEEPPLNFSQDDIEALLAANSPAKRTKADEPLSMPVQNQIDDLLGILPPVSAPVPAQTAASAKEESSAISQDDIEALLSANSPKPVAQTAEPAKEESSAISQDDIEALLSANSPKPVPQTAAPAKEESSAISQDDIEALLSANSPKPVAQTAAPAKEESSAISQDDIEALLSANSPKPVPQTAAPAKEESSAISQDDIEALLSANSPKQAKVTPSATPAPSLGQEDVTSGFDQANIDSLFAANAPAKEEAQALGAINAGQDDIDALLAANSPSAQSSMQSASEGQNEIDALLASAVGKPTPKPAAAGTTTPPKADGEILSQSDLDSLLSEGFQASEVGAPSESRKNAGTISELEIDSILDAAGIAESERGGEAPEGKAIDDGLLSQDTLDSLLAEASQEEAGAPDAQMAQATDEPADDELERLLSGEEDSLGEALFQDGSKTTPSSTGEPSLDEMLAGELTPRPPARSGDDDHEHAGALQGVFAQGDVSVSLEEDTGDEEARAEKKSFNPLAIFAPFKKVLGIIPFPKFKFIGAIFHKLPPRLAGVMTGLALAVVIGAIGGGWWFLKGGPVKDNAQVAQKEADHKPAAKPEAPSSTPVPAKPEAPSAAPVPGTAPAVAPAPPPALAPKPSVVFAKASSGKYPVSFVVYLPVEFDAETTKILNMNVELLFESETVAKIVRERLFFSAVTVEKAIDGFFRDKFYEETVFAQDKLEEYLAQNLKTVKQFAGLKDVRLSAFSID
jgi:predicted Zn finger-like uncharacterized protein